MFVKIFVFFFFKQKTAYEMRISDWSSDVCSSDLLRTRCPGERAGRSGQPRETAPIERLLVDDLKDRMVEALHVDEAAELQRGGAAKLDQRPAHRSKRAQVGRRSTLPNSRH